MLRFRQGTSEPKYSGTMNPADTRISGLGVGLTPGLRGLGPLRRPPEISQPLADTEHVAVGPPGGTRRQLTGGRCGHRLVNECHAFLHLAERHQGPTPVLQRQRLEIGVADTPCDLESPVGVFHGLRPAFPRSNATTNLSR